MLFQRHLESFWTHECSYLPLRQSAVAVAVEDVWIFGTRSSFALQPYWPGRGETPVGCQNPARGVELFKYLHSRFRRVIVFVFCLLIRSTAPKRASNPYWPLLPSCFGPTEPTSTWNYYIPDSISLRTLSRVISIDSYHQATLIDLSDRLPRISSYLLCVRNLSCKETVGSQSKPPGWSTNRRSHLRLILFALDV